MLLPVASLQKRIKYDGKKKIFICIWKCIDVEYKQIAFVTRSTEKKFVMATNLDVPQFLFPLKKIKSCNS